MNTPTFILCFYTLLLIWLISHLVMKGKGLGDISFIFLTGILVRFGLAYWLYEVSISRGETGAFIGRDDLYYLDSGRDLANYWQTNRYFSLPLSGKWAHIQIIHAYHYICGIANFVFGQSDLPILLSLNSLIGAMAVFPTYTFGTVLGGQRVGKMASLLVALHPRTVFWASLNFRDCYLLLILTFIAAKVAQYLKDVKVKTIPKALFQGFLLVLFRHYLGYLIILGIIFIGYARAQSSVYRKTAAQNALFAMLVALLMCSVAYPLYTFANQHFSHFSQIQTLAAATRTEVGSIVGSMAQMSPIERLMRLPFGLLGSFITPFPPWRFSSDMVHNIAAVINIFWLPLLGFLGWAQLKLYRYSRWHAHLVALFILLLLLPGSYATFVGSSRSLYPGLGILMSMIAFGICNCKRKIQVLIATGSMILIGTFLYYSLHG